MRLKNSLLFLSLSSCVLFAVADAVAISECGPEDSKCGDGSCLPKSSLCNSVKDCPRGEDERYCNGAATEEMTTSEYCSTTEFRCYDGSCIPLTWVCDGYRDCHYGEDEEYCSYSTTDDPYPWTTEDPYPRTTEDPYPWTTPKPLPECNNPFQIIGNKCIMIEPLVEGTWYESRYFCQGLGGDLVVLDSMDSYVEIVRFLNEAKLTTRDYWVGATDEGHEGQWLWVNWVKVVNGTPLWAIYGSGSSYEQEPTSSYASTQDCGFLDMNRFYYMADGECIDKKAAICEIEHYQEADYYQEDETYSGKILEFLKSSEEKRESSEKDLDSLDSGEVSNANNGEGANHEKVKDTESHHHHHSGHEEPAVEGEGVKQHKALEKVIARLKANASQGKVGNMNKTSKKQLNTKPLRTENTEKFIEKLKAKIHQARFGNMNLLRP